MSDKPLIVKCPRCRKEVTWDDRFPHRPFCSDRCRQLDLGAWSFEEYRIPGPPADPNELPEPDEEDDTLNKDL